MATRDGIDERAVQQAAALLREARLTRTPLTELPVGLRPTDEREAYAIQDALSELLVPDLGPVIGYKVGCTTPALQAFMNIVTPSSGAIFASTQVPSGGVVERARGVRLGLECEMAVRLGADLDLGGDDEVDRERVAAAVASCFTSIEIVDERYADYRTIGVLTLIADEFMDAGLVLGPERSDVDPLTLDRARGATTVNGRTIGGGVGSDVLGHPLEVLVWLARAQAARGKPLRSGMIVTLGSMVTPYFPEPGDVVTMTNDVLGEATVTVR